MSVLWCGAEDIDLPTKAIGFALNTTGRRVGYSRTMVQPGTASNTARTLGPAFSAATSLWATARCYISTNATSVRFFGLTKSGTSGGIAVGINGTTSNKIALWLCAADGSTWTEVAQETGTSLPAGGTAFRLDLQIETFGATTRARVYFNSDAAAAIDYTGDLRWTGATELDQLVLYCGRASSSVPAMGEMIVADEDTRVMSLVTLAPSGVGDANSFTGGTYADIDESTVANDADIMSSGTAGQAAQVALSDLPAGTFTVKAVKVAARALHGASGPTTLKLGVRSGGTTDVDAGRVVNTVFTDGYERLMLVNPVTGTAFTQSEIDALQLAFETAA